MEPINILVLLVGFMAGLMLWIRLTHIAVAIFRPILRADPVKKPANVQTRTVFLYFFSASCLWLVIFGSLCAHFFLGRSSLAGWAWFFGGMTSTPAFVFVNVLVVLRRHRRERELVHTAPVVPAPGAPSYTYRFTFDEPHIRTMIDRYYEQKPFLLRPLGQLIAVGVVMFVVLLFLPLGGSRVGFLLMMAVLYCAFAAAGLAMGRSLVYQKFRYTSSYGKSMVYVLAEDGLHVQNSKGGHITNWPAFRSAVRYSDGLMLLRRGVICWLPDVALEGSVPANVDQFLGSRMRVRSITYR